MSEIEYSVIMSDVVKSFDCIIMDHPKFVDSNQKERLHIFDLINTGLARFVNIRITIALDSHL